MYNIGQVSELFNIPISTLRYYDKEGLFPNMRRESGIRKFDDNELNTLNVIECLKKSGLEIKQIRQFMKWCSEGSSTYQKRLELFQERRKAMEAEMARLQQVQALLEYKCWYYTTALEDGDEERLADMARHPETMPPRIRELYELAHPNYQ